MEPIGRVASRRRLLAVMAFVPASALLFACGGRSVLDGDADRDGADAAAPAMLADASAGGPDAGEGGPAQADAGPDAAPAPPCHLVRRDDPVPTISFPAQPNWSFHQEGLLLRSASPDVLPAVVQYGNVEGAGTDGWGDPALYAAEYDVSQWPPRAVHEPTRISDADEGAGNAIELPGGQLFFTWLLQVDNAGLGPTDVLYQAIDGHSWALAAGGTLVKHATFPSPPALAPAADAFSMTYVYEDTGDAGPVVALPPLVGLDGRLGSFGLDFGQRGDPSSIWSATGTAMSTFWYANLQSLARTRTDLLAVAAFDDCPAGLASAYCEARSIVVLRVTPGAGGAPPSLEKAAVVPMLNPDDGYATPGLFTDARGHNWLTWWESPVSDSGLTFAENLYAVPLSDRGEPLGPLEGWLASDHVDGLISAWDRAPSVGPLGVVYPVSVDPPAVDAGAAGARQVHLVHRQLDAVAPVEDITFTTPYSAYAVVAVQIAEPRSLVVGYSTYPSQGGVGYGELARYTCAEDSD